MPPVVAAPTGSARGRAEEKGAEDRVGKPFDLDAQAGAVMRRVTD